MSDNFNLEGSVKIESRDHTVEYEPGAMVGLGTVFLRVTGKNHNVPIHISQIDDVIEMLERGKKVIIAIEGRSD